MSLSLRLGRWEDVFDDEIDALICDPPHSARTHASSAHEALQDAPDGAEREAIDYEPWTPDHVHAFVRAWSPRTRGWMACMTSHDLIPAYERAYEEAGRYVFAPVPIICTNPGARMLADGPANGAVYLVVARRPTFEGLRRASLPPHYMFTRRAGDGGGGRAKDLGTMRRIVRDYSEPSALVGDPVCGLGTTLIAASLEGRSAIGSESHEPTYRQAVERLGGRS